MGHHDGGRDPVCLLPRNDGKGDGSADRFLYRGGESLYFHAWGLSVCGTDGMMEIAVKSGLMKRIAQVMYPFIHWLFPDIPRGHKANEYIAANMAANILGLGWGSDASGGFKAMQELQSLDEGKQKRWTDRKDRKTFLRDSGGKAPAGSGRASDMMCAFLVLNISSLQLIPINMIALPESVWFGGAGGYRAAIHRIDSHIDAGGDPVYQGDGTSQEKEEAKMRTFLWFSDFIVPFIMFYIVIYGFFNRGKCV